MSSTFVLMNYARVQLVGSEDIVLSERSKRGVVAFREFLAFAETGRLRRGADGEGARK